MIFEEYPKISEDVRTSLEDSEDHPKTSDNFRRSLVQIKTYQNPNYSWKQHIEIKDHSILVE